MNMFFKQSIHTIKQKKYFFQLLTESTQHLDLYFDPKLNTVVILLFLHKDSLGSLTIKKGNCTTVL